MTKNKTQLKSNYSNLKLSYACFTDSYEAPKYVKIIKKSSKTSANSKEAK